MTMTALNVFTAIYMCSNPKSIPLHRCRWSRRQSARASGLLCKKRVMDLDGLWRVLMIYLIFRTKGTVAPGCGVGFSSLSATGCACRAGGPLLHNTNPYRLIPGTVFGSLTQYMFVPDCRLCVSRLYFVCLAHTEVPSLMYP